MKTIKQIVAPPLASKVTSSGVNPKKYIVVHQTGNTNKGAGAQAHANIQSRGNARKASWHESTDDKTNIQSFEHSAKCWHAGDGSGKGNGQGIGIELCINSDADYLQVLRNGAKRIAELMKMYNIPISNVIQHHDCSGKNCPAQIRAGKDGVNWTGFINMVKAEFNGVKAPEVTVGAPVANKPKPAQTITKPANPESVQDWMNANPSVYGNGSFANRKKVAQEKAGIQNYSGTEDQNIRLLDFVKNGKATPAPKPAPQKASAEQVAQDIAIGKGGWGTGDTRVKNLTAKGYNAQAVQNRVNEILRGKKAPAPAPKKSVDTVAREIAFKKHSWGNNPERANKLRKAGYNPDEVQKRVNQLLR